MTRGASAERSTVVSEPVSAAVQPVHVYCMVEYKSKVRVVWQQDRVVAKSKIRVFLVGELPRHDQTCVAVSRVGQGGAGPEIYPGPVSILNMF